jgi:hypothetical protein
MLVYPPAGIIFTILVDQLPLENPLAIRSSVAIQMVSVWPGTVLATAAE